MATPAESKIKKMIGPFTVTDPAKVVPKEFDRRKFIRLGSNVRVIIKQENEAAGNNTDRRDD
jgi:hypothetical protein